MATYGKRRHILPVLSAPRGSAERVSSKRTKRRIQGSLTDRASTTYHNRMSGPASLPRRDSIDKMADILLDDTAMEMDEHRVDHTIDMHLSDTVAMPDHTSKPSSHLGGDRIALVSSSSSPRNLPNINPDGADRLEDERLAGVSPTTSIQAGGFSPAHQGVLPNRPPTRDIANKTGKLQSTARTAEDLKPDGANYLTLEGYQLHKNHQLTSNISPHGQAMLDNRSFHRPEPTNYTENGPNHPTLETYRPHNHQYKHQLSSNNNPHGEAKLDNPSVHGSKLTNNTENNGSLPVLNRLPQTQPPPFNPLDLTNQIERMMAASNRLKGNAPASLHPEPQSSPKTNRFKDNVVVTKIKTAMNHIHFLGNKKSPEPPAEAPDKEEIMSQPQLPSLELRMNEGDNLNNPKIVGLTGHGKIRRKPLPDNGKLLRSRNASSYQLAQSMSAPMLALSSDMPSNSVEPSEADNTTEPFPLYDTNFDIPFSSSPIAQSTPRVRVATPVADDSVNEDYSDMDLDIKGSEMPRPVKRDVLQSKVRPSARSGGSRMKKHPTPCKADLEKWESILKHFPDIGGTKSQDQAAHDSPVNVYLHPPSSVLGDKPANYKLHEANGKQDNGNGAGTLGSQVAGVAETSAVMEDAPSRNKGRKSFVSKHRNSNARSRERTRSGRPQPSSIPKDLNRMDTDELQWDMTPLMKKAN